MVELGRGSVSALHPACTLNRGGFVMQDQITIDSFVESTIRWQNLMRIKFAKFAHLQEKSEKSAS